MSLEIFSQRPLSRTEPVPVVQKSFDRAPSPSHFERTFERRPTPDQRSEQSLKRNQASTDYRRKPARAPEEASPKSSYQAPNKEKDDAQLRKAAEQMLYDPAMLQAFIQQMGGHTTSPQNIQTGEALSTSGNEILSTLSKLYHQPEDLRQSAPILSLLTGHVEELIPEKMPQLILGNGFIQDAMAQDNIDQFFTQPMDLSKILDDIGLHDIADKIKQMTVDSPLKSPKQIFDALGLDSQTIVSELKILSNYLNTEGLNPYMVRAAALRGSESFQSTVSPASSAPMPESEALGSSQLAKLIAENTPKLEDIQRASQLGSTNKSLSEGAALEGMPLGPWESQTFDNIDSAHPMAGTASSEAQSLWNEFALRHASTAKPLTTAMPNQQIDNENIPNHIDESIAQMMQGASIIEETEASTPNTTPLQTNSSLQEGLSRLNIESQQKSQDQQAISSPNNLVQQADGEMESGDLESPQSRFGSFEANLEKASEKAQAQMSEQMGDDSSSSQSSHDDSSSGQRDSSPRGEGRSDNFFNMIGQQRPIGATPGIDVITKPSPSAAPQNSSQVRDLVLENAQMMLKDGGGTMRLDLGTEALGKLDLAIDVQNDNLRLKITAESDKARELLSQELPALRQALMDQSLNLKTVELGLRHEEKWTQSNPDQGQFQQGQGGQPQGKSSDGRPFNQPLSWNNTRRAITRQMAANTMPINRNGNIQIRV